MMLLPSLRRLPDVCRQSEWTTRSAERWRWRSQLSRATVDVDLTLFLDPTSLVAVTELLLRLGCQFDQASAISFLREHGYCRTTYDEVRVDLFLPTIPFYDEARARRLQVELKGRHLYIWDAEVLAVFKLMFFRTKDLVDVERILVVKGDFIDRQWIRRQLVEIFGRRDPRVAAWDDLVQRIPPDPG